MFKAWSMVSSSFNIYKLVKELALVWKKPHRVLSLKASIVRSSEKSKETKVSTELSDFSATQLALKQLASVVRG